MNIYVNDKLKAEYEDAVAKLKADRYKDEIPQDEKLKLEEKVWVFVYGRCLFYKRKVAHKFYGKCRYGSA